MKIESKRLILRSYEDRDISDLVEGLNNIEVAKWMAGVPLFSFYALCKKKRYAGTYLVQTIVTSFDLLANVIITSILLYVNFFRILIV